MGDDGQLIYFDGIDNSAYVTGKSPTSARNSFIYIDGEALGAVRADIGGDPDNPDLKIAWKYLWTAKDTWLGPEQILGGIGALYNLTMDPYEKYDMTFNGAVSYRLASSSPGKYSGQDNGWVALADLSAADRVRQVDHQVPEHPPLPWRSLERPAAQSAGPVEPGAGAGSEQAATHRWRRAVKSNGAGACTSACPLSILRRRILRNDERQGIVRFEPVSGHRRRQASSPLSANSGHQPSTCSAR